MSTVEVQAEAERSRADMPVALLLVFAIWLLYPLVQLVPEIQSGILISGGSRDAMWAVNLLQLASGYVVAGLAVWGLLYRFRFVHRSALVWQATYAGFGAYNLWVNDYGWEAIWSLTQIAFYFGVFPLATGILTILLLLLPASIRWADRSASVERT